MSADSFQFIKKYVLANPKNNPQNYSAYRLCQEIPATCEEGIVKLPNVPYVSGYLNTLTRANDVTAQDINARTIYVINLVHDIRAYILPILENPNAAYIVLSHGSVEKNNLKNWTVGYNNSKSR